MYYKDRRSITLQVPARVWGQIQCIVDHYATEVSWYGDITREDESTITINNVYLFPQEVTGGTFRTDTPSISEKYDAWYDGKLQKLLAHYEETGETRAIMQYNGHSHVQAGVQPSGEDVKFRKSRDGINVYSIHNKKGEVSWEIWLDDVVYEHSDIDIVWIDGCFAESEEFVKTAVTTYGAGYYKQHGYTPSKTYTPPVKQKTQTAYQKRMAEMETQAERNRIAKLIDEEDYVDAYGVPSYSPGYYQ